MYIVDDPDVILTTIDEYAERMKNIVGMIVLNCTSVNGVNYEYNTYYNNETIGGSTCKCFTIVFNSTNSVNNSKLSIFYIVNPKISNINALYLPPSQSNDYEYIIQGSMNGQSMPFRSYSTSTMSLGLNIFPKLTKIIYIDLGEVTSEAEATETS